MSLEITTNIGCPNRCDKYCPQEVIINKYSGERLMSMATFKSICSNTPKSVRFIFSGFSEPFANPLCVDFIEMAAANHHAVLVNSTLWGLDSEKVERLSKIRFSRFTVHIPDGKILKNIAYSNYKDTFFDLCRSIPNLNFMTMNEHFKSNLHEHTARNILPKAKSFGYCERFSSELAPVILPNGDAYLCCQDWALRHHIGNLCTEPFHVIRKRIQDKKGSFTLCNYCEYNVNYVRHLLRSTIKSTLNNSGQLLFNRA
jgi:hypothetical protein